MKLTRRSTLKGLGAAALAPLTGASCDPADPLIPATIKDRIDTVVVLMMENRSFDHVYGARSLVEGRAVDGLTSAMSNPRLDGSAIAPARADLYCVSDPGHGWSASHRQWNGGSNDGFVAEHEERYGAAEAHRVMSFFLRADLPVSFGLADHYALCERWHCSLLGPTWPNRYYSLLCTSSGIRTNEPVPDELPPIFEPVYKAGRSFGIYYGNMPFAALSARLSLEDPEFRYLEQFFDDAAAGTLPNFVWIDPIYGRNDDHPPAHPQAGQALVNAVYRALAESPQWERCLFVVTYDEHGGFFDHVPPPKTADDFAADGFDQLGFRVPSFIVGPYVKEGHVSSTLLDHTSIYRTLRALWGLPSLSTREAAANHFLDVIDLERIAVGDARAPADLGPVELDEEEMYAAGCVTDISTVGFSTTAGPPSANTGQPELEAALWARYGAHPKNRTQQSDEVFARFMRIARDLGAWRPKT